MNPLTPGLTTCLGSGMNKRLLHLSTRVLCGKLLEVSPHLVARTCFTTTAEGLQPDLAAEPSALTIRCLSLPDS